MRLTDEDIVNHILLATLALDASEKPFDDVLKTADKIYISPFVRTKAVHTETNLSYGLSYAGYDVRLDKVCPHDKARANEAVDYVVDSNYATAPYVRNYVREREESLWLKPVSSYWLMPGEFCLGSIIEYLYVPRYTDAQLKDKSSLVRRGIQIQNTVVEPGWMGYLTVEISNHGHIPILLEHGMPIGQLQFTQLTAPVKNGYEGKYQNQTSTPVPAR